MYLRNDFLWDYRLISIKLPSPHAGETAENDHGKDNQTKDAETASKSSKPVPPIARMYGPGLPLCDYCNSSSTTQKKPPYPNHPPGPTTSPSPTPTPPLTL